MAFRALILTSIIVMGITGCSHNPNKAEKIDTKVEKSSTISGNTELGVKDGNMVVQRKTLMSEELRELQYDVYGLEDRVYGNVKYASTGLYGALKGCRLNLSKKENGGTGKLMWTEPVDRVTDKEDDFKMGLDEQDKIVGVTEEFLKDRLNRFREYKRILNKRNEEYEDKIEVCKAELNSRKFDQDKEAQNKDAQKAAGNN